MVCLTRIWGRIGRWLHALFAAPAHEAHADLAHSLSEFRAELRRGHDEGTLS